MRKNIVSLILEENGKFLIEKRDESKSTSPETVIFPAGHVKNGESKECALLREMREELRIIVYKPHLIYVSDFDCEEDQRIHWYACTRYKGRITNNENQELLWIKPSEDDILTHDISRNALKAYLKYGHNHKTKA